MSIITEALNRLQAERARRPGQPRTSATSDSVEAADSPDPVFPFLHFSARALRNHLPSIAVGLGVVGLAAYLWGLPLIAAPDKVPPEQETVKEWNSVQHVPSQIVEAIPEQREESFTPTVAKANEDPKPTEAVSATAIDPSAQPTVAKSVSTPKPRSSPGLRATAAPTRNADSVSSNQRKNRGSSFLRNATPLQVTLVRAQIFIKKRQYARAVTVLQSLFVQPPERWEPWFWLGTAQLGLGQWEKALASLVEGLARDATVPQLWVQRALVSQQQGRFGEALDALRQAELLAPKLPEVQLNLAYALDVEGNRLVAVRYYRTFLALTEGRKAYHGTRRKVLDRISHLSKT
ncbi:MAG: tetratricopeptide repeat protein [Nitrospira sp.]|nr:tetratricopeptide repeat protein [Nitrospira sp.]